MILGSGTATGPARWWWRGPSRSRCLTAPCRAPATATGPRGSPERSAKPEFSPAHPPERCSGGRLRVAEERKCLVNRAFRPAQRVPRWSRRSRGLRNLTPVLQVGGQTTTPGPRMRTAVGGPLTRVRGAQASPSRFCSICRQCRSHSALGRRMSRYPTGFASGMPTSSPGERFRSVKGASRRCARRWRAPLTQLAARMAGER